MIIEERIVPDGVTPQPQPKPPYKPDPPPDREPQPAPKSDWAWVKVAWMAWAMVVTLGMGGLWFELGTHHHPTPPPDPIPKPEPRPGPIPPVPIPDGVVQGKMYVTYVVDGKKVTPAQAAIRSSKAIRDAEEEYEVDYQTFQEGQPELIDAKLEPTIARVGLPCALFQNSKGDVLVSIKDPGEQTIIDTIKHLRGK